MGCRKSWRLSWLWAAPWLACGFAADAQSTDPLPPETVLVAASGAAPATQESFTIAAAQDLLVTFTDLQTPAALTSASLVVTQGATIVGTTSLPSTATPATTATLALPAAVGQYTLRVVGTPSTTTGAGTFTVCVAPKATPTACIANASIAGSIAAPAAAANPTVSTLAITLTVATAGTYTFTYADDQFPVALAVAPTLALFQGSTPVAVPVPASPAAIPNLSPGTYTLLVYAQADATTQAGLFGITVSGPAGVASLLDSSYPIGLLAPASSATNPAAQLVSVSVTDFAFPAALTSASAALTSGGMLLGTASARGAPASFSVSAPAGTLQVWNYGVPGTGAAAATAGTYEVDVTAGTTSLLQSAYGVNGGGLLAYAFVTPALQAGTAYTATANDFQFPSALTNLQFAVAQNHVILGQSPAAGSVNIPGPAGPAVAAAPAVLLVAATPATANGNGLFDVNIQNSGNSQLVFDQVQPVSAAGVFTSLPIPHLAAGDYDVTLTDLQFPPQTQFATLALVSSSNGAALGKIYGGGTSEFTATGGNYEFFLVAIPAGQYGLYGLQIVNAPPTVKLTASPMTVVAGASTTLSWTSTDATSCTGSGGSFAGTQATGGSGTAATASVVVSTTTTFMLTCAGPGGTSNPQSVTVTATAPPPVGGGGGGLGLGFLGLLGLLASARIRSTPAR